MGAASLGAAASVLRHFNRFYTAQIGVLDRDLLGSGYSLAQARVLYELATREDAAAGDLTRALSLDGAYLSRILHNFEKAGLLQRRRSATDGRVIRLGLTAKGHAVFAKLDRLSQRAAETLLSRLPGEAREEVLGAVRLIEERLAPSPKPAEITLRPHRVGDMGWIVHRQAVLYTQDYGWDNGYEALISEIAGRFLRDFKPDRERCFVAEREGKIVGSAFVVEASTEVAKLRLLYVEPAARGQGLGRRLVEACIGFAQASGYARLDLWTNDILTAARRIYESAGFELIKEERHRSFGHDLVGQTWSLDIARGDRP